MDASGRVYIDDAATTPVAQEVLEAMLPWFRDECGNADSLHTLGAIARHAVELAREQVASAMGADTGELYFTSGGTESNNWAVKGVADLATSEMNHTLVSATEHKAVLQSARLLIDLLVDAPRFILDRLSASRTCPPNQLRRTPTRRQHPEPAGRNPWRLSTRPPQAKPGSEPRMTLDRNTCLPRTFTARMAVPSFPCALALVSIPMSPLIVRITVSDASLWSRRRRSQRPRRLAVDPSTGCDDFVLLSLGRRQDNPAAFRDSLRRGMRRQPVLHLVAVRFVQSNWHRLLLYEDSFAQPVVVTPLWPRNK